MVDLSSFRALVEEQQALICDMERQHNQLRASSEALQRFLEESALRSIDPDEQSGKTSTSIHRPRCEALSAPRASPSQPSQELAAKEGGYLSPPCSLHAPGKVSPDSSPAVQHCESITTAITVVATGEPPAEPDCIESPSPPFTAPPTEREVGRSKLKSAVRAIQAGEGFKAAVRASTAHHNTIQVIVAEKHHHHDDRFVVKPHSSFCRAWHLFISISVLYVSFIVPFDACFSWWRPTKEHKDFHVVLDIIFFIDMALSFRTGFVHSGHLVTDPKKIAKHYLEFWFWIDLIANVPWEKIVGAIIADKASRKSVKMVKWLKIPRLMRLGAIKKMLNRIKGSGKFLPLSVCIFIVLFNIHIAGCTWIALIDPCANMPLEWAKAYQHEISVADVIEERNLGWVCKQEAIGAVYAQAVHKGASVIFGNSVASGTGVDGGYFAAFGHNDDLAAEIHAIQDELRRSNSWEAHGHLWNVAWRLGGLSPSVAGLEGHNVRGSMTNSTSFATQSYSEHMNTWGLSFFTGTYLVMTIWQLTGVVAVGLVLAMMNKIIVTTGFAETRYRMQTEAVSSELEHFGCRISDELQYRMHRYFQYRWYHADFGRLQMLNEDLMPNQLRGEIAVSLYHEIVMGVPFLSGIDSAILAEICLGLEHVAFLTGDVIYNAGDAPHGLYLIEDGEVVIRSKGGVGLKDLREHMSFGGSGALAAVLQATNAGGQLLQGQMRKATHTTSAHAVTVCRLLLLSMASILNICARHPEFVDSLRVYNRNKESLVRHDTELATASATIAHGSGHS